MNYFSSDFTLGIIGGGQLGKMLLYETRKYDIKTFVLEKSSDAPCKISCDKFVEGDYMDYQTVYQFGKTVDLLTIEIEHINTDALKTLESEGVVVHPSSKTLKIIQNKHTQKCFYINHNIPTADFKYFEKKIPVEMLPFKFPFIWKLARFGYDGYGVKVVQSENDYLSLPDQAFIIEKKVNFKLEVSVIIARSSTGQIKVYPPVEMEFHPESNQVEYIICPARISDALSNQLQNIARKVSENLNHVGVLAVEMFVTSDNQVLVNECAPRPHNSGHFSIEASYTNQFEQHLRAILGLPLGKTYHKINAVMVNLVGEQEYQGAVRYLNIEKIMKMDGVIPHIYGKKQTRPFRKMGHVTVVNSDLKKARIIAEEVKNTIKVISQ